MPHPLHLVILVLWAWACLPFWEEAARGQEVVSDPAPVEPTPLLKTKAGKTKASPEQKGVDFRRRDKNKDGQLTLVEHLGQRQGDGRVAARDVFFHSDVNGDELLTLEEFVNREKATLTTHSLFRLQDIDDDGQLSEEEFMRTRLGKKGEQVGRENFHRFDVNHDGRLNEREFAITPAQNPTPEIMFAGLDVNADSALTRDEYLASFAEGGQRRGHRDFLLHDRDRDGRLNFEEYSREIDSSSPVENTFAMLDYDADGTITLLEFSKRLPPKRADDAARQRYEIASMRAEDRFWAADLNRDGRLTAEEFEPTNGRNAIAAEDDEDAPPTAEPAAVIAATATGIGPKRPDLLVIAIVVCEILLGVVVAVGWLTRNQNSRASSNRAASLSANVTSS